MAAANEKDRGITTRHFRADDDRRILALFQKVFGNSRSWQEWEWKFPKHCLKHVYIRIAEDSRSQELIGQYALIPVKVQVESAVVQAALSLDTMVDERFRGRGLFTRLADELYSSPECSAVGVLIGFPNGSSFPGFVKRLKWKHVGDFEVLIRPLRFSETLFRLGFAWGRWPIIRQLLELAGLVFKTIFRIPRGRSAAFSSIVPVKEFDRSFDSFFQRLVKVQGGCRVQKDHRYMNWRYVEPTHIKYEIFAMKDEDRPGEFSGYLVLSRVQGRGAIVDLLSLSEEASLSLVGFAVSRFREQGMAYCLTWANPAQSFKGILRRHGFLKAKSTPFIVRDLGDHGRGLKDLASWRLMPGDNDTY